MENYKSITVQALKLSYQVFGEGLETVVCLHGHGRSSDDFHFLKDSGNRIISIDLFFHNDSTVPENRIDKNPLEWHEVFAVFQRLFEVEQVDQFHVLAFSQGGRFALLLLEEMASKIRTFTLLSPDGLNNGSFYNWSSRQKIFRSLFHRWIEKPEKLQKLSNLSVKARLMRPKVRDFVHHFTAEKETMIRAAQTWMAFRKLQPNPKKIGAIIQQHHIPLSIIMGKYDQVIRPKQAYLFLKNANLPNCVVEIENGHDFFKPSSIAKFRPFLPFLKNEKPPTE